MQQQDSGVSCRSLSGRELQELEWTPNTQFVVDEWTLPVRVRDVLASQGADPDALLARRPQLGTLAGRVIEEESKLVQPRFTFRCIPVDRMDGTTIELAGRQISSELFPRFAGNAEWLIVVIFTVGPELDERITELFKGRMSYGLAVDGLANAAMALFSHEVSTSMQSLIKRGDKGTSCIMLQPGVDGWPLLAAQQELFGLIDATAVGVELRESGLMVPNKTCSGIIAVGKELVTDDTVIACDLCMMKNSCPYRGAMKE